MPTITFLPDGREVKTDAERSILQAALDAGIPHTHVCGGRGLCSTCRVMILDGLDHLTPRTERERLLATRLGFTPAIRLACQTRVTGDVRLRRLVLDAEDVELSTQLNPANAGPVGEEKLLAILFADIRGFTRIAEALPPYDVIHLLNRYYRRMDHVIAAHRGRIDNYMGDGLMALFGLEGHPDPALHAVEAGLGMLAEVEALRPYVQTCTVDELRIGIGIHWGEVVVGTLGVRTRRITAIGDAVNFASRIESATKSTGARLLISQATCDAVRDRVRIGRHFTVAIPGKSGEHTLYEVLGVGG